MASQYYEGVGRRKTASARVRIISGEEGFVVNGKPAEVFFSRREDFITAVEPLEATGTEGTLRITVKVKGGGITGQAGAIRHGLARALLAMNPEWRASLRSTDLLTRDSRIKERKKPGLKRARKAPQYTKR